MESAAGVLEQAEVTLEHGCVSCTLREDVLPTLLRLAGEHPGSDILLEMYEKGELQTLIKDAVQKAGA